MSRIEDQAHDLWQKTVDALAVSTETVDHLYDRLAKLQVELDDDPLAFGPKRLSGKISLCRKALAESERIFLMVSQRLEQVRRAYRASEAGLLLARQHLFANDPEVRSGRNVADREALAAIKLQDKWLGAQKLDQARQELEAAMVVIKAKRTDLKDTEGRLRDQVRLCMEEIGLGSQWGAKAPPSEQMDITQGFAATVDTLDALVAEVDKAEIHVSVVAEEVDESVEEEAPPMTPVVATEVPVEPVPVVVATPVVVQTLALGTALPGVGSSGSDNPLTEDLDRVLEVAVPAMALAGPTKDLTGSGQDVGVDQVLLDMELPERATNVHPGVDPAALALAADFLLDS